MSIPEESVRAVIRALTVESLKPVSTERLLEAVVASLADPYPVLRQLARLADDPHTVLLSNQGGAALGAMVSGAPSTEPGLALGRLDDGRLVVTEVIAGGAASTAGLKPGDLVLAVGGEPPGRGIEVVGAILSAAEGSTIAFEVERAGEIKTLPVVATKSLLPLVTRRLVDPGLGYIRLRWITTAQDPDRDTATLLRRALEALAGEGARAIVIDLRGNQGGYGMARVASVLTDGDPIAIYRHPSGEEEIAARVGERSPVRLPLAVLVDEETNSAAEMVALAVQQHQDARIIGRPTAGGLNVPLRKPIGSEHVLMVPGSHVLGPRTRTPNAGMRIIPDVITPGRSIEALVLGHDPQLEAAKTVLVP